MEETMIMGSDPLGTRRRIRELMEGRNWTEGELAKASGLSYSTVFDIVNRGSVPQVKTLDKLCRGFGMSLSEFFREIGK